MKQTVTLCVISSNEAEGLLGCLRSASELADEMVVVETGDRPAGKHPASALGARVIYKPWNDDFSAARNAALEEAHGDWILFLDSDEELLAPKRDDWQKLLDDSRYIGYWVTLHNLLGEEGSSAYLRSRSLRLFRRDSRFRYQGRVHENILQSVLKFCPPRALGESGIVVRHYGYLPSQIEKHDKIERNIRLILKTLEEEPLNPFWFYNLGVEYLRRGEYQKALVEFDQAEELLADPRVEFAPLLVQKKARALWGLQERRRALDYIREKELIYPDYTDLYYLEGQICLETTDFTAATTALKKCLELGEPKSYYASQQGVGREAALEALAIAWEERGEIDAAIGIYLKWQRLTPENLLPSALLVETLVRRSSAAAAREFVDRHLDLATPAARRGLAQIFWSLGFPEYLKDLAEGDDDLEFRRRVALKDWPLSRAGAEASSKYDLAARWLEALEKADLNLARDLAAQIEGDRGEFCQTLTARLINPLSGIQVKAQLPWLFGLARLACFWGNRRLLNQIIALAREAGWDLEGRLAGAMVYRQPSLAVELVLQLAARGSAGPGDWRVMFTACRVQGDAPRLFYAGRRLCALEPSNPWNWYRLAAALAELAAKVEDDRPRVSLCLITKDEEDVLLDCLKSARHLADEMIIVDTGSQDHTVELAQKAGARVFHYSWTDDFSAARNRALDLARGQWVLVLDADERLRPVNYPEFKSLLMKPEFEAYCLPVVNYLSPGEYQTDLVCRLFRRKPEYRFVNPLHEQVIDQILKAGGPSAIGLAYLPIDHLGYLGSRPRDKEKSRRNCQILRKALAIEDRPFLHYALGTEELNRGNWAEAAAELRRAKVPQAGFDSDLRLKLAYALKEAGRFKEALEELAEARRLYPAFTDLYFLTGEAAYLAGDEAGARAMFTECLRRGDAPLGFSGLNGTGTFRPRWYLARLALDAGRREEAITELKKALQANPGYSAALELLSSLTKEHPAAKEEA